MNEKHAARGACDGDFTGCFFGSVTVGERGQIVIPAEARQQLGFQPGDKLLVMRHPLHKGLMVFKFDSVRDFVDEFARHLAAMEEVSREERP